MAGSLIYILISITGVVVILVILQFLELKKIRSRMEYNDKVKNILFEVAEKIIKATSENEVYSLILDTAIELVPGASKGSILLIEEDSLFHFKTVKGFSDELKKMTIKKEEAYLYSINNFSETAIIKNPNSFDEDVMNEENVRSLKSFEALDISCTLTSPIYMDEKLIGMMNVDSTLAGKTFTDEDLKLMNYIKNELQLALKNSFIQSKLKYMANFDELTGLYNRRLFKEHLTSEYLKIMRYKTEGCLVLIDLDNFKVINDNYGHNVGDRALKLFANVLRENIRKTDVYARMSGDEFVILFVNCNKANAIERMESIRKVAIKTKIENIPLGFSYGICSIEADSNLNSDDIFGIADKEMYLDKNEKINRLADNY
ncbi:sensor domain-containing diguanylate cyclase [Candidatus Clostridium radicumherbarum]|uniref:GGDEF domain-containing protein n=1 Tax=Candidatus Clostridium radicumherbarum TaxID=3381662 RepID=A0ABW8TPS6_9CLOT